MKKLCNFSLICMSLLALNACSNTEQFKERQAEVAQAVDVYENQLVKPMQSHAVISGQPRPVDLQLVRSPYRIQSVDGQTLALPEYSFSRARPLPRDLGFSFLKVPLGRHDLVIAGGYGRAKLTTFKNVNFEATQRYVIAEEKTQDEIINIYIAEYKEDTRFTPHEAEFYVVGKPITPLVELGSQVTVGAGENK